ncbi:LysR family transcriptional regulator [Candidatus Berkiella cookevillensis]|uniref:HTH-type transcriptional regulator BenM n=1 Tax=Candidatus Berkiella cookevillensis TaxID=437022 RepID=A0A0Q9YN28_9GAMM|nr:LysR family transcriptional regulator [Candidatus Berkiella cookevillensis]MCS5707387.1 LysR family transcriptional regulator [Candidatus Berkiella cookevillensis]
MKIKSTLDQWLVLKAVLEQGGFAQAAEYLHRSQSTISYTLAQLQSQLDVKILETKGRKAVLTPIGQILYHRANLLLENIKSIENIAKKTTQDWPAEISIVLDDPFPRQALANALKTFSLLGHTRVQIYEESLSGALERLEKGTADIVITFQAPKGHVEFCQIQIVQIAVAHIDHPLHHLGHTLRLNDLRNYTQLIVRDSAELTSVNKDWVDAPHCWTVASSYLALGLLQEGTGFAWMPVNHLLHQRKLLKALPLAHAQTRRFFLNALYGKKTPPNQATLAFAKCLEEAVREYHQQLNYQVSLIINAI